jgi:proteasome lid subunit RPN8/RPN11
VILHLVPAPNAARSRDVFRISSASLASARRALRRRGLFLSGCFHTHPMLGPEPSGLDLRSMYRFPFWWLIYSPMERRVRMVRSRGSHIERAIVRVR